MSVWPQHSNDSVCVGATGGDGVANDAGEMPTVEMISGQIVDRGEDGGGGKSVN